MLELAGVTKHFGGLVAISHVDLEIEQGELVGIIGPNGAGKTTLFNLITGFLPLTRGDIFFEGERITGQRPSRIARRGIVRTFQGASIFPDFTVRQNVAAACGLEEQSGFWACLLHTPAYRASERRIRRRAEEIVQFVGLEGAGGSPAHSLPHGQKRTLGIAIALAAEPSVLLLDEPFCGMTAEEVDRASALISTIWESGTTVFLIEHNMKALMRLCPRIVVISFGQKIADGPPEAIRQHREVIESYLGGGERVAAADP